MTPSVRRWLHRFVPKHFEDPFGLTLRLIRSGDEAARFAMLSAALGLLALPLDLILQLSERRRCRRAGPPTKPILLVCGPPRSGTTLLTQVLIRNLPVAFINNLTAVFPRSPLTANRMFARIPQPRPLGYRSYYGKSSGFAGPNDGLHLWDRWLGDDRTRIPDSLPEARAAEMVRFFGAFQALYRAPVVAKNNSLNATAHLVAQALPTARFICLRRDPVYLAQSLLRARLEIHGSEQVPYGLSETPESERDPIVSVCRQVEFHERLARQQLEAIGRSRFWVVSYEEFCRHPRALVERVAADLLGQPWREAWGDTALRSFEAANQRRIDPDAFGRLERILGPLRESMSSR